MAGRHRCIHNNNKQAVRCQVYHNGGSASTSNQRVWGVVVVVVVDGSNLSLQ